MVKEYDDVVRFPGVPESDVWVWSDRTGDFSEQYIREVGEDGVVRFRSARHPFLCWQWRVFRSLPTVWEYGFRMSPPSPPVRDRWPDPDDPAFDIIHAKVVSKGWPEGASWTGVLVREDTGQYRTLGGGGHPGGGPLVLSYRHVLTDVTPLALVPLDEWFQTAAHAGKVSPLRLDHLAEWRTVGWAVSTADKAKELGLPLPELSGADEWFGDL